MGQLGLGDLVSRSVPTLVSLEGIIDMGGGDGFSLLLTNTSQIYSFGIGSLLGLGNTGNRNVPTLISTLSDIHLH
jgi:alpha-tubulin suppressor-like RCC1 family protein